MDAIALFSFLSKRDRALQRRSLIAQHRQIPIALKTDSINHQLAFTKVLHCLHLHSVITLMKLVKLGSR